MKIENLALVAMGLLLLVASVEAVEIAGKNIEAGITPDNKWAWKVDKLLEKIELKLTRDKVAQIEKRIMFAQERAMEANRMAALRKSAETEDALNEYSKEITEVETKIGRMDKEKGIDRAILALEQHKTQVVAIKMKIIARTSDEDKKKRMEEKMNVIISQATSVQTHLKEVQTLQAEKTKPDFTPCQGVEAMRIITKWQNPLTSEIKEAKNNCEAQQLKKAGWSLMPG